MKHFVNFLLFLALFAGCHGEETSVLDSGAAYFPLQTGVYQVYTVHEVRYQDSAEPEVLNYELMTEVVDSFPSGDSHTFVLHRSRRFAEADPWEVLDTWSVRREGNKLVVSEGNVPIVKLLFPVRAGTQWNGNTYNSMGEDIFAYEDIGRRMEFNGMTFENTMTVEQEFNEDLIVHYDARKEVYAHGAGLVYKEVTQLNYCTEDHCLGQQEIENGTELKMEIREYGEY
ncbi:MAG: hypothetical protein WEB30_03100 [Cyclobacteriaceae bacterium]